MVFKPGESGNTGGRSKELAAYQSAVKLKAASHADEVVGYYLKVLCWHSVFDRSFGRFL
jgi:hypothetical protein